MSQNQTGKYLKYAIGEIILVVVGILIALQINSWNENRQESIKEDYYLKSIRSSIDLSQAEFDRVINDAELVKSCADSLFVLLAQKDFERLNGKFLDSLLFNAADYSVISLNDGGIQEILNTSSLDLIKDNKIRLYLVSWNDRLHKIRKYEEEAEYVSKQYNEILMGYIDMKRIMTNPGECRVIPEKELQLLNDPMLANYLARITGIHNLMYQMYSEEKKEMNAFGMSIDEYLNTK